MDSLATFVDRTQSKRLAPMETESFGLANSEELIRRIDPACMRDLASVARTYVPAVRAEVDELYRAIARNPQALARRALLFGMSTPNNDERDSLQWAMAAFPRFGTVGPRALANTVYRSCVTRTKRRVGMRQELALGLKDVYRDFANAAPDDLYPEALEQVRHVGPKVARMITAVANPDAHVWTVDLWHGRQLLWAAGLEYRAKVSVTARAYPLLERVWLDYRDEYFSDQPCWVAQWATWDAANGQHEPHRQLWADLAA